MKNLRKLIEESKSHSHLEGVNRGIQAGIGSERREGINSKTPLNIKKKYQDIIDEERQQNEGLGPQEGFRQR